MIFLYLMLILEDKFWAQNAFFLYLFTYTCIFELGAKRCKKGVTPSRYYSVLFFFVGLSFPLTHRVDTSSCTQCSTNLTLQFVQCTTVPHSNFLLEALTHHYFDDVLWGQGGCVRVLSFPGRILFVITGVISHCQKRRQLSKQIIGFQVAGKTCLTFADKIRYSQHCDNTVYASIVTLHEILTLNS